MRKPVVWITQEPMRKEHGIDAHGKDTSRWVSKGLDIASASEYGSIAIIWPPAASVFSREMMERDAMKVARSYDHATDYIVALGSPTLIAVLSWAIGREDKILRMLEWDKGMRRYYPTLGDTLEDALTRKD